MCKIVDYSEKAIAIVGNTKEKKDELKKLGGRFNAKLRCGAGWVFPKSKLKAIETFLNTGRIDLSTCKEKNEYKAKEGAKIPLEKTYINANGDEVSISCSYSNYYKLPSGHLLSTDKQKIQTRFWIGENGYDFDEKQKECMKIEKDETYFLYENLKHFDEKIKALKDEKRELYLLEQGSSFHYVTCVTSQHFSVARDRERYEAMNMNTYDLTPEDRDFIIKIYEQEKAEMEKRLKNYLKRYGLSKISADTYWVDR